MSLSLMNVMTDLFAPLCIEFGSTQHVKKNIFKFSGFTNEKRIDSEKNTCFLKAILCHKIYEEISGCPKDEADDTVVLRARLSAFTRGKRDPKHSLSPKELLSLASNESTALFLREFDRIKEFFTVTSYLKCIGSSQISESSDLNWLKDRCSDEKCSLYEEQIKKAFADEYNRKSGRLDCPDFLKVKATPENITLILTCLVLHAVFDNDTCMRALNEGEKEKITGNIRTFFGANLQDSTKPEVLNDRRDVHEVSYLDLLELGYTDLSIAQSLVANDWKLYKDGGPSRTNGLTQENEGTPEQWAEYLSSFPDTFRYLLDADDRIVGNLSFVSVTREQEEAFEAGLLTESAFTPAETRDLFSAGDDHIMFLLNLSLNDEYSTPDNNTMLRRMFLSRIVYFAKSGILFNKIIVNVFKSSHEAFFKQWGFSFVGDHRSSGRIYELKLRPYPKALEDQLSKNPLLRDVNEQLKVIYGE